MNETVMLWILGALVGALTAYATGGTIVVFMIVQRLTKLETIISLWGEKFANILHSPHTPELDTLLEKLARSYREKGYDLSNQEWQQLKQMTSVLENDETLAKGERLLAGMINALCEHKLGRLKL